MTDETEDIEILPPEEVPEEIIEEVEMMEEPAPKRGVTYPVFLVGLLLASLLGAAGGVGAAYYFKTEPAELSSLQNDIANLERAVSQLENKPMPKTDLSRIEARLSALENAPAPTLPDIDPETLSRLESLQEAGAEWPDMSVIEARLEALENRPAIETQIVTATPETLSISAPIAFPKEALIEAANNQPVSGGFFKRALSKHVQVKDADHPLVMIDAIETAIADGDLDIAKAKFDALPSTIRSAGQDWRNSLD